MTIHAQNTIDVNKVKIRWEEPYVSEALNKSMSTVMAGIHHGFRLVPAGGSSVKLAVSSETGDSLALVTDESQNLAFAYRETVEQAWDMVNVDGSGTDLSGTRAYFLLYVNYGIGQATEAEVRIVDEAEMANPWTAQAIKLGSVRVPSSGSIFNGHIEHATAHIAGASKGRMTLWNQINDNPSFDFNFAGYGTEDSTLSSLATAHTSPADVLTGKASAVFGSSTPVGADEEVGLAVPMEQLEEGDLLFFKATLKGSNFAGDANVRFRVTEYDWNTLAATTLIAYDFPTPSSDFEEYGFLFEVPAYTKGNLVVGGLSLQIASGSAGEVVVDRLDVFQRTPGEYTRLAPKFSLAAEEVNLGNAANNDTSWVRLSHDDASMLISGPDLPEKISVYDSTHNTVEQGSLVEAADQAHKTFQGLDGVITRASIDGGVVTANGTTEVDISEFIGRLTFQNPSTNADRRLKTFSSVTALSVPTGENSIVYADFSTDSIVAEAESNFSRSYDIIPLAYVEASGGVISKIVDIKDYAQSLETSAPLAVTSSSSKSLGEKAQTRFYSFEGAMRHASLFYPDGATIQINGQCDIGEITEPISLPSNVHVRGSGPGSKLIYNVTSGTEVFLLEGVTENVTFENLQILLSGNVSTLDVPVFRCEPGGDVKNVEFRNVVIDKAESTSVIPYEGLINNEVGAGPVNGLTVDGCKWVTREIGLDVGEVRRLSVRASEFDNTAGTGNVIQVFGETNNVSLGSWLDSNSIEGCKFKSAGKAFFKSSVAVTNCEFHCQVDLDNSTMSNSHVETDAPVVSSVILGGGAILNGCKVVNNSTAGGTSTFGVDTSDGDNTITGCSIFVVEGTGIKLEGAVARVTGTLLSITGDSDANTLYGIYIDGATNVVITGCQIYEASTGLGVYASGGSDVVFTSSTIYNAGSGHASGFDLSNASNTTAGFILQVT